MKNLIFATSPVSDSKTISAAFLVLRVVVGVAFIAHGYGKILSPFSWMPPEAPVPGIFQALAALSEFGGGIALLLGLLTRVGSLGILATMTVAVFFHVSKGDGFVGGYELALAYWAVAWVFLVAGAGRFSVDALIKDKH